MRIHVTFIVLVGLVLCAGCGASGAKFSHVQASGDLAVIYLYRNPHSWGAAISATIKANDSIITRMTNGGYFPYITEPGMIKFSGKIDFGIIVVLTAPFQVVGFQDLLTLEVESGKVYYLKGEPKGPFYSLEMVSPEVGQSDIKKLKKF